MYGTEVSGRVGLLQGAGNVSGLYALSPFGTEMMYPGRLEAPSRHAQRGPTCMVRARIAKHARAPVELRHPRRSAQPHGVRRANEAAYATATANRRAMVTTRAKGRGRRKRTVCI